MERHFGLLALAGLVLTSIVHIAGALHAGIFVVFVPFIFFYRKTLGSKPTFGEIRKAFPSWVIVVAVALFAYAFTNSFRAMALMPGGGVPSLYGNKYVQTSRSQGISVDPSLEFQRTPGCLSHL
jgi:hypothetical protein